MSSYTKKISNNIIKHINDFQIISFMKASS